MRMFPDKEAWAAMIRGVASSYYSVSEASFVLDRGPWGTPANLGILREFIDPQAKFLVLLRPVEEVVASFMRLNKVHDEAARDSLMKEIWDPNSVLSLGLWSSRNLVENAKDQTLVVHYHDFVKDPSLELERVYDFFGLQRFRHDFTAFTQLEVRGVKYNDDAHTAHNTHLVKTDGLFPSVLEPSEYLDYGAIEEMRKLNFWDS